MHNENASIKLHGAILLDVPWQGKYWMDGLHSAEAYGNSAA